MINKKRLAMIAVAASMMLPTNLAYLSTVTPVFAAEETGANTGKITGESIPAGFTWGTQTVNSEDREVILLDGEYSLESDITITKGTKDNDGPIVIVEGKTATLKLNGYTLTSNASGVFKVYGGGNLIIEGPGKIVCNSAATNGAAVIWTLGNNPQVTLKSGVELEVDKTATGNNIHGIGVNSGVTGGIINVEEDTHITVEDGSGVYTNGMIFENGPTINLNKCIITASTEAGGLGIYQAGDSTINVSGGTITANCGIETRGGRLNVKDNAIVNGGTGETVSKKSGFPTNGSTSRNAAIAIAQHVWASNPVSYPAITANIASATLNGKTALAIVDPEGNQAKPDITLGEITIDVTDSTLTGNVAYTTDEIKFTLTNPNFKNEAKIQKFIHNLTSGDLTPATDVDLESIPYTVINTIGEGEDAGIPVENITNALPEGANDTSVSFGPSEEGQEPSLSLNLTLSTLEDVSKLNDDTLSKALTDSSKTSVSVTDEEGNPAEKAPNYIYNVNGLEEAIVNDQGITLEGDLGAAIQLTGDSVIKLLLPNKIVETQSLTREAGETPEKAYYVEASKLGSGHSTGTLEENDINKYCQKNISGYVLAESDEGVSYSYAENGGDEIAILGENKKATLDSNGFLVLHLEEDNKDPEEETPTYTISPSPVLISVPANGLSKEDINLDSLGLKLTSSNDSDKPIKVTTSEYKITSLADASGNSLDSLDSNSSGIMTITAKDGTSYNVMFNTKLQTSSNSSGGGNKKPTKPAEPEEPTTPVVGTPTTMYRLYNKLTGEHLYTIDKNERDNLLTSDTWKDEGQGWIAPSTSDYPVYRLLNPNNGDHHYTTDKNEFDTLPTYGWVAEGLAFFSADKDNPENVILHRLYNPNAEGAGSHHYTADTNERDTLVAQGWTYEGTAWAGLPANK